MRLVKPTAGRIPTMVDLTADMVDRAATAIMAAEAERRLTDLYGQCSRERARTVATRALEAALDLRVDG